MSLASICTAPVVQISNLLNFPFTDADSTNAALITLAGLDVPAIRAALSDLNSQLTSGRDAANEAQDDIQGTGIVVSFKP